MKNFKRKLVVLSALTSLSMAAQDLPTIISESAFGYLPRISVSPGQIVTLYVRGLNVAPAVSKSDPLARELSGVYVLLEDANHNWTQRLPLMRIGTEGCARFQCRDANIVAQIPYDLPSETLGRPRLLRLTVFKNGKPGALEEVGYADAVPRLLNSCMAALRDDWEQGGCGPLVTRQDGSRVSSTNPFVPGETISLYAWGLGPTDPKVEAGVAVQQSARTVLSYRVRVCYECFGLPEGGWYSAVGPWFEVEYAGVAVGSAGLYQINIKTPTPSPEERKRFSDPIGTAAFYITSSATLEVSTFAAFRAN